MYVVKIKDINFIHIVLFIWHLFRRIKLKQLVMLLVVVFSYKPHIISVSEFSMPL